MRIARMTERSPRCPSARLLEDRRARDKLSKPLQGESMEDNAAREDDLDRKRPRLPDPGTWAALIRLQARSPQVGLGDGWRTRFRASRPSPNIHVTRSHFGTRPSWVLNLCGDWLVHMGAHVSTTQASKIASALPFRAAA
jgi:hypothetical protein